MCRGARGSRVAGEWVVLGDRLKKVAFGGRVGVGLEYLLRLRLPVLSGGALRLE